LAFSGNNELVGSPENGNFLGILELMAEYDTFLAEHIQRQQRQRHVSYFSPTVCEEFIDILAKKVLNFIIFEIKQAKYYSVSVDSTPDITNVDQLTIVFFFEHNHLAKYIPSFFSSSTHRWNLLIDALKPLHLPTIKPLSNTRW
uniref:Uncharacterized protein n=1 Tax=Ciona savignyi TaxID=51511 RepID=H2YD91_CIOSA